MEVASPTLGFLPNPTARYAQPVSKWEQQAATAGVWQRECTLEAAPEAERASSVLQCHACTGPRSDALCVAAKRHTMVKEAYMRMQPVTNGVGELHELHELHCQMPTEQSHRPQGPSQRIPLLRGAVAPHRKSKIHLHLNVQLIATYPKTNVCWAESRISPLMCPALVNNRCLCVRFITVLPRMRGANEDCTRHFGPQKSA